MKHVKISGLALVISVALLALLGVATTSATVICKNNLNTNVCSEPYAVGTKGTASLTGSMTFKTTGGTTIATCTSSTVSGTLETAGSSTTTPKSNLTTLTFSGCSTTVDVLAAGTGEPHWTAGTDNGVMTTSGTRVTVNFLGVSCIFKTAATAVGTLTGGNPGTLDLNGTIPEETRNFGCPSSGILSGTYIATEPKNAWLTSG